MARELVGAGSAFLNKIFEQIPDSQREAISTVVSAAFAAPEAQDALDFIGRTVASRDDLERQLSQFSTKRAEIDAFHAQLQRTKAAQDATSEAQTQWWNTHRSLADLGAKAQEAGWQPGTDGDPNLPAALPKDLVRSSDLEKTLSERERGAAQFFAVSTALALKHMQEFGTILDIGDLIRDPRSTQIGIEGVYQEKFREQYSAKAKKVDDDRLEAAREEGRREARKQLASSQHPSYPTSADEDPSPLDKLVPKPAGTDVQELVDAYDVLREQRRVNGTPA